MQIQLNWPANPASELVSHYEVWEQVNGGFYNLKTTEPLPQHVFTPSAAVYRWKVRAVNFVGVSGFSAEAEGPSAPSTPGTITVTTVS